MTDNWAYYGFQGWLHTEEKTTSWEQSANIIVALSGLEWRKNIVLRKIRL